MAGNVLKLAADGDRFCLVNRACVAYFQWYAMKGETIVWFVGGGHLTLPDVDGKVCGEVEKWLDKEEVP